MTTDIGSRWWRRSWAGIDALMLGAVLLATFVLMIPAMLHGAPFIFLDTQQYFLVGKRIVETLLGSGSGGSVVEPVQAVVGVAGDTPAAVVEVEQGGLAAIAGGRSPIYAVYLYVLLTTAGIWVAAALQALTCSILIFRFGQMVWGRDIRWFLASVAVLALVSSLGFHATFMMPDVFAGCMVLTLAVFLFAPALGRIEAVLLIGASFVFATMHTSNVLLAMCAIIAVVMIRLVERAPLKPLLPRLAAVAGVVVATFAFASVYATAVRVFSGDEVRSIPYLTARVIGDGPGERYLASKCTSNDQPFAACAYAGMDFKSQDEFLSEPAAGGYVTATSDAKIKISGEDVRFALAVAAWDPLGQAAASFGNFAQTLVRFGIDEVDYGLNAFALLPDWHNADVLPFIPGGVECVADKTTCEPPGWTLVWTWEVTALGIAALVLFAAFSVFLAVTYRRDASILQPGSAPIVRAAFFLVLMVVANAVICGVFSGVHDRYQARVGWVLFLALGALLFAMRGKLRLWTARQSA